MVAHPLLELGDLPLHGRDELLGRHVPLGQLRDQAADALETIFGRRGVREVLRPEQIREQRHPREQPLLLLERARIEPLGRLAGLNLELELAAVELAAEPKRSRALGPAHEPRVELREPVHVVRDRRARGGEPTRERLALRARELGRRDLALELVAEHVERAAVLLDRELGMLARRVRDAALRRGVVRGNILEPRENRAQPLLERRVVEGREQRERIGDVVVRRVPLPGAKLGQRPAIGLERVHEDRPVGAHVRAQLRRVDAVQRLQPALVLLELGRARLLVGHDQPVGVFVVADRDRPVGIELPEPIEERVAELAAERRVGGALGRRGRVLHTDDSEEEEGDDREPQPVRVSHAGRCARSPWFR